MYLLEALLTSHSHSSARAHGSARVL